MPAENRSEKHQWEREPSKEEFWRAMLEEWKASGMTIRAFANLKSVSEHSLYGWRRELQMREREAALAEGRAP
ncbi:MAG: hypothetical protein C0507_13985, partial [Cyanobacteria bacterium PR.3.49]|nr:hypothetical protein [Cyanobacteria bacterium PR.3.49]